MCYKYNENREIMPDYPRRIADDFGSRPDSNISLPSFIDAVWHYRTSAEDTVYFFQGDWVRYVTS